MGQIDFTNIIIDDFRKGKLNPFNKYIYILTHIHSDHLRGLTNSWNYGPIYCSRITANLILNKFPNLASSIKVLPLQEPTKIKLAANIFATVTFFDANHCAGAVLVLLEGYFGRFLYSGDFRYDRKKFSSYTYLYPPESYNQSFEKCSRPIDKLWLDNTFCNPRYKFLTQSQALSLLLQFIKSHQSQLPEPLELPELPELAHNKKTLYIGMDNYGKEQVLTYIAKQLDTIIVVDQKRYQNIIAMEFDRELFTTNPEEGFIFVVPKPVLHQRLLEDTEGVGLVMSGWCVSQEWRCVRGTCDKRIYYIPYSSHSNFNEIISFVKSIQPSQIQPIVSIDQKQQQMGNIGSQSMYNTQGNAQAFENIIKQYTSALSQTYKKNLNDKEFQEKLKQRLGLDRKSAEINKTQLGLNTVSMPARGRGYKLNTERNQDEIKKIKDQIEKKKAKNGKIKGKNKIIEEVEIFQSDEEGDQDSDIRIIDRSEILETIKKANKPEQQSFKKIQIDWQKLNNIKIQCPSQIEQSLKQQIQAQLKQPVLN